MRAYEIISEKAVSKKQQQFFGIVRAMQKGDMPKSGEAGEVAKDMKKSDVKDFAKTKHKGLPTKKKTNEGADITVYTDPSYQGATLDDKYWSSKPSQKIDFDKLEPFEPESKMKAKKSADNMKRFVDKIKAGEKIKPIIVTPKDGKYLILDGHHRYFAARIAKVDSMEAVVVPEKFVTFTDEVPDESEQHKQEYHKEEAAGVGIVTKQNATADVPVGGEYMNVKKLFPKKKKKKESIAYEDMFQGLNPKSEIYVDMDGVLADFFGEWKKLVGKDWRQLGKDEIEPALKKIRDEDKFWLNIPLTSNAKKLLGIIKQVKGSYKILSSPLANDPNSEPHKREWIKKNLDFFPPTEVIITKDKAKYATNPDGTPNILIDDYGVNIAAWESAGGIGFKHKDHKFERTAKKLKAEIDEDFQNLMREFIEGPAVWWAKQLQEAWSAKYKKSINCSNPKGFSQKAHCAGRKKKESYTRDELPQIKNKQLENIEHEIVFLNIDEVKPVQKERIMENFKRQVDRLLEGVYSPVVVDCDNRIVNGHHRYDAVKLLGETSIPVARIPHTLECIIENFADGKKKGKSRPGRVKKSGASCKGSVTSLRAKAKKYGGEKGRMYHWCANMKGGKKKAK